VASITNIYRFIIQLWPEGKIGSKGWKPVTISVHYRLQNHIESITKGFEVVTTLNKLLTQMPFTCGGLFGTEKVIVRLVDIIEVFY
jgi:hypothetical protein